jgi:hypothetical protein
MPSFPGFPASIASKTSERPSEEPLTREQILAAAPIGSDAQEARKSLESLGFKFIPSDSSGVMHARRKIHHRTPFVDYFWMVSVTADQSNRVTNVTAEVGAVGP